MLRRLLYVSAILIVGGSCFLPLNTLAQTRVSNATRNSPVNLDFPVPDPLYIYNQFAYVTSHFQRREAGYTANQGHDQFAAYWTQEMMNNLAGFGAQARRDTFPVQGWRERPATLPAFNMEVTVPGLAHPEQEIIVGCHYDGKANSTESALDDTSGCTYELGVGKAMGDYWRSHHVYPARTVRFVIFDAEEQGLFGSFHYLNSTINGDLSNVLAMFNEEQSGINYPARFLGRASNPFMPDYIDVTPLQDNAAYPGRIHFTPLQRERVVHFRDLWQQAIPAVFAQFQAAGYSSLDYYDSNNQNITQPIFTPEQQNNVHIQDDPSSNSDQVPFIYAGLPVVTVTGDQSYYDPNPPIWAFPYDLPEDTLALMNTYTCGAERPSAALALGLALPAMLTTWMLNQPDMLGQATADGNPIAAISDIGQTVVGQNIALDAKSSFDPSNTGNPLSYAWNFGDGVSTTGISVNHTYRQAGNYTLTLTVTSPGGKRTISKTINVGSGPNYYSNPYSPLGGINRHNPAVTIATANNNLPAQPFLNPPFLSIPAPTVTAAPATATSAPTVVPDAPAGGNIVNRGPSPLLIALYIFAAVALIVGLGLVGIAVFRARNR
ncbi:MAG TPA: M28 family peptidase [Ktedonobacteraceae bacterium]|nr:M28 family peptidase [Ktedonobacteraceae bacterium]